MSVLAAAESDQAGPLGLLVLLLLVVAIVFLARSMFKHLRKVPASFDRSATATADRPPGATAADPAPPADPAGDDGARPPAGTGRRAAPQDGGGPRGTA